MIMERLTQNMLKLHDSGGSRMYWDEKTSMLLIITELQPNRLEQYRVVGIDPDSGEVGGMYAEAAGIGICEPEEWKMMQLGMKMLEMHKSRCKTT